MPHSLRFQSITFKVFCVHLPPKLLPLPLFSSHAAVMFFLLTSQFIHPVSFMQNHYYIHLMGSRLQIPHSGLECPCNFLIKVFVLFITVSNILVIVILEFLSANPWIMCKSASCQYFSIRCESCDPVCWHVLEPSINFQMLYI